MELSAARRAARAPQARSVPAPAVAVRAGLTGCAAAIAALAALALPAALDAQAVRSARLSADLAADGGATVEIEYELTGAATLREVEIALLGFDVATTDELLVDGRRIVLDPASGSRRRASVALEAGAAAADERRRMHVAYRVASATALGDGRLRARIPVATLTLAPMSDSGDVFRARLSLPDGWSVAEGFPTRIVASEPGVYTTGLRVVPSVVSLRGRTDGAWRPGVKLLLDVLALSILLGVAIAGRRHMRSLVR